MQSTPVIIATNGYGIPVVEAVSGTPVTVVENGFGTPIVLSTNGMGMPVTFDSAAAKLLAAYSFGNGLAFSAADNSLIIRDSVTPANDYVGPLVAADGTMNKFTFTRASTATFVNSSGLIQLAAINVPRIDYSTGSAALLIEGAATNLCLQSEDLTTTWSAFPGTIITANSTIAPDGTLTADTLTDNSAAQFGGVQQLVAVANDSLDHTFSIFVKKTTGGTSSTFGINFSISGGVTVAAQSRLNTDTGLELSGAGVIEDYGDYWRLQLKVTNNSTGNTSLAMSLFAATNTYNVAADVATATGSVVLWGAQLEKSSIATSYIPTTTVAVTRAVDACSIPNTLFNLTQAAGTLYTQNTWNGGTAVNSNNRAALSVDDGTANERHYIYNHTAVLGANVLDGGVSQTPALTDLAVATNVFCKSALAYAVNDFALVQDGRTAVVDGAGTLPTTTTLRVGNSSSQPLNGNITEGAFFGTRLSNANMQALTT